MPRDGGGVYSKPAGTTAVSGTTIESAVFNQLIDDIVADQNTDRPVVAGGTGASDAATARTNLGAAPIASPVFTGVVAVPDGAVGAPSVTNTGDLNTGMWFPAADTIALSTAGAEALRVDANGTMAIGDSPEAWDSSFYGSLQIAASNGNAPAGMTLATTGAGNARLLGNAYYDGAWKRSGAGYATAYEHNLGTHNWDTAGTSTADSAITWATRMHLTNAGVLVVGTDQTIGDAVGGDILVNGGVFLGGTGAANYIDDYEEGTFTPTIEFGGAAVGVTYSEQLGIYTKVGRMVHCVVEFTLTAKGSSSGNFSLEGLPFTVGNNLVGSSNAAAGAFATYFNFTGVNGIPHLVAVEVDTKVNVYDAPDADVSGTGTSNLTDANLNSNSTWRASFSYMV